jgi:hypothetical protein
MQKRLASIGLSLFKIALLGAASIPGAMAQFSRCDPSVLMGSWSGAAVTDNPWFVQVDFRFNFNPNWTYEYAAGQGNFLWVTHAGTFAVSATSGPAARKYACQVTITPAPNTVNINTGNQMGLAPLQSRDLMDDRQRTFYFKEFPRPGSLLVVGTWADWVNDIGSFSLRRY